MAGKGDFSVASGRERSNVSLINDVLLLDYTSSITERRRDQAVVKTLWESMKSASWGEVNTLDETLAETARHTTRRHDEMRVLNEWNSNECGG